eukprot:4078421-Amphidinium_carterae.1
MLSIIHVFPRASAHSDSGSGSVYTELVVSTAYPHAETGGESCKTRQNVVLQQHVLSGRVVGGVAGVESVPPAQAVGEACVPLHQEVRWSTLAYVWTASDVYALRLR